MTALGVSLLCVGALLILLEAHVPTLGVLGGPGVLALAVGAVLAVIGVGGGVVLGLVSAVLLAGAAGGVMMVTIRKGAAVNRRRVRSGPQGLIGHVGVVRSWDMANGCVQVDGALWNARHSILVDEPDSDSAALHPGDRVVVDHLEGLTVGVRRAEEWEVIR